MKRFLTLLPILLFCLVTVSAQSVSDDKAIEYARQCYTQGMSKEQAMLDLQSKGVTVKQMQRLKEQYDNGMLEVQNPKGKEQAAQGEEKSSTNSRKADTTSVSKPKQKEELTTESVFGHNIFKDQALSFEPNLQLATPSNYIIGAGDRLGIMIFGSYEVDLSQKVSPEGRIFVSNIGPVYLKGLTIEQARTKLQRELSAIYSGLTDGSASMTVTVSNIRSIQINVMGEVSTPGTYTLPSLATVFHALYASGGVTDLGTMRDIRVIRNNKTIGTVDIYKFLMTGDKSGDIVLQDGDVILVGPYIDMVSVDKGVKRSMKYEMKEGETVNDLILYAGGFTNDAFRTALNIVRQNDQGLQAFNVKEADYGTFKLADGDKVLIGKRYQRSDNQVVVEGAVYNPGTYAIDQNVKTIKQLLQAADGLREDAFMDRALLQREMPDWTLQMESIDLNKLYSGEIPDVELRANDQLFVASKSDMRQLYTVTIAGPVSMPGDYIFSDGITVKDLIVRAGGLLESASLMKVDVSRRIKDPMGTSYSPMRSQIFTVNLGENLQTVDGNDLILQPFDIVHIRRSPNYKVQNTVTLEGEILFSGDYTLENAGIRVSEIIRKAGGITSSAFIEGASLQRKMTPEEQEKMNEIMYILSRQATRRDSVDTNVFKQTYRHYNVGFDLKAALDHPGSAADIILQPDDIITVPEYNGTVQILGSVLYPNAIVYEQGKKLDHYVKEAGGYSNLARKSKVFVLYMNGTAATGRSAKIVPGCKIVVPMKSNKKSNGLSEILGITSTTASMASIVASMAALFR